MKKEDSIGARCLCSLFIPNAFLQRVLVVDILR